MFLQSWKTPMWNGYLRFFVVNTCLDNDAENQSLLCTEIMRRGLAWITVTLCIRVKHSRWTKREYTYKNYRFAYNRLCLPLICYKLILSVFFIKIFGYLRKICCLSKALNLFWFRLVYLEIDKMLQSYGLPEKLHHVGKNVSVFGTGFFFQNDPYLVQKDP